MAHDRGVGRCQCTSLRAPLALILTTLGLAVLAGCGGSGSSASGPTAKPAASSPPAVQPPSSDTVALDAATVRRKGYDPTGRVAQTPDGSGHMLYAFHGTCHGSAD